jgi:hypothetical protein
MPKDINNYLKYIGYQIEGAITEGEKITNVYMEGDKVFAVIDDEYEAEFDCVIVDLINGGEYVRVK